MVGDGGGCVWFWVVCCVVCGEEVGWCVSVMLGCGECVVGLF